ncbi:alpha/beta fold hydrolase [Sinomonas sp. B1-1]|uniref:alpha/beta fold hydrolase n=1 Tax=Sinomonas sp. B1-1 TaxID=3141454 RepID=UPI003D2E2986
MANSSDAPHVPGTSGRVGTCGASDDDFQKLEYARRYVEEIPNADLVVVEGKHIPTEDSPHEVARAIVEHLGAAS